MFAAQLLTPPPGTEPMVSFLSAQRKGSSKGQVTIQGQEASECRCSPSPTLLGSFASFSLHMGPASGQALLSQFSGGDSEAQQKT